MNEQAEQLLDALHLQSVALLVSLAGYGVSCSNDAKAAPTKAEVTLDPNLLYGGTSRTVQAGQGGDPRTADRAECQWHALLRT